MSRVSQILSRRKIVHHDFYTTAEQVCGVVLLNSPVNGAWEYEEYLRLLHTRRYTAQKQSGRCYFICADGSYLRLRAYIDEHKPRHRHLRLLSSFPLCDAVIGDMDSHVTSSPKDDTEIPSSMSTDGFGTVEDIPAEVLESIHTRGSASIASFLSFAEHNGNGEKLLDDQMVEWTRQQEGPLRLFVRCQMSTDFMKSLRLIERIREQFPNDAALIPPSILRTSEIYKSLETGGDKLPRASDVGSDIDPNRERALSAEASLAEVVALPTFLAIGALGGRFDHEMGAISVLLSKAKDAHVVISDATNTIFACQPNGWTQFVREPHHEGTACGLINYGTMKECETSGLLWNVVIGRGKSSDTKELVLQFGKLISACNTIRREVVTIDLRCFKVTREAAATTPEEDWNDWTEHGNPPTLFSIQRL